MVHSSIINSIWQPLPTLAAVKLVPIITIFYGVRRIVAVHVSTQVGYYLQTPVRQTDRDSRETDKNTNKQADRQRENSSSKTLFHFV